jgi:hypothetical protein
MKKNRDFFTIKSCVGQRKAYIARSPEMGMGRARLELLFSISLDLLG